MRFFSSSIVVLAMALAMTGCAGKSSTTDSSNNQSASASTSAAPAGGSSGDTSKAVSDVPEYPGATTQAAGSSSSMGTNAAGKVMWTTDSFDKVYGWYQQKLPAGSEKSHVTSPTETAVFTIGDVSSGQTSVTLTTQSGKTMITIAHVKM